jgi:hypothetical protein
MCYDFSGCFSLVILCLTQKPFKLPEGFLALGDLARLLGSKNQQSLPVRSNNLFVEENGVMLHSSVQRVLTGFAPISCFQSRSEARLRSCERLAETTAEETNQ